MAGDHGARLRGLSVPRLAHCAASHAAESTLPFFAARARSAFFEDVTASRPMTTYGAWRAFAARSPESAAVWRARLEAVDRPTVQAILDAVPPARMSGVCRDFTMALLMENRRRILSDTDE